MLNFIHPHIGKLLCCIIGTQRRTDLRGSGNLIISAYYCTPYRGSTSYAGPSVSRDSHLIDISHVRDTTLAVYRHVAASIHVRSSKDPEIHPFEPASPEERC